MDKKSFFELLDPKSAMIVGLIGGVLSLGTVGFIILGIITLTGGVSTTTAYVPPALAQVAGNQEVAPPPVVPKTDKPKVELFVMSYCPYGLQMEKAYIPAWELLKKKADIDLKFVSYIMHDRKELDENSRQYCIQKDQNDKFISYLKCFTASGNTESCLASTGVNKSKVSTCMAATHKQFKVDELWNDKSTWLSSQFALYNVHAAENEKYGVQGSPTLIINGVEAQAGRTPEAVKQAICAGFNNPPAECQQTLSNSSYEPGFGSSVSAGGTALAAASPACGN